MNKISLELPHKFCKENCPVMDLSIETNTMYAGNEVYSRDISVVCRNESICRYWNSKPVQKDRMDRIIKCSYCKTINHLNIDINKELNEVGKTVISCTCCDKLFQLRDDGDGEYIREE